MSVFFTLFPIASYLKLIPKIGQNIQVCVVITVKATGYQKAIMAQLV